MYYNKKLIIAYSQKMSANWSERHFCKSPSKPKYFTRKCLNSTLEPFIELYKDFNPFKQSDFYMAHSKEYVDAFYNGLKPLCESNGLEWSPQFVASVSYTNASLYNSICQSILEPKNIYVSPCCGFHHAVPYNGYGYCTFSGQVIASLKLYNQYKLAGAYIDLDAHDGNSIEDSRVFCKNLNNAIPIGFNINPKGKHKTYINNLAMALDTLEQALLTKQIHYVVYCHGADSHEDDDLGFQLNTKEWLQCTKMVCDMMLRVNKQLNTHIPFTYCLFGGYREDDYTKVIDLHYKDVAYCFNLLTQT
jgi:acetoin utilization deacetylase AcuC-like enzyme